MVSLWIVTLWPWFSPFAVWTNPIPDRAPPAELFPVRAVLKKGVILQRAEEKAEDGWCVFLALWSKSLTHQRFGEILGEVLRERSLLR
jgi:hypothetical protein